MYEQSEPESMGRVGGWVGVGGAQMRERDLEREESVCVCLQSQTWVRCSSLSLVYLLDQLDG